MKRIYLWFFLCLTAGAMAQQGTWTWMSGLNSTNSPGSYGTQGVPSPTNMPPSNYEAASFTDQQGNFWIFGGVSYSVGGAVFGALWKYDPQTNLWTWMKGPATQNVAGVYGTQGVASPANYPGCRGWGMASWTDNNGDFWIFGGLGYDALGGYGSLNDLWKYEIASNSWTWVSGSNTNSSGGNYGTLQVASSANQPPARHECANSWKDCNGDFWVYGGYNLSTLSEYADMWRYNIASNQWTWMSGSQLANLPAVHGTLQVPAATNTPGGRSTYAKWTDDRGYFWLYGGGYASTWADMWRYDPIANTWTWMNGSNQLNDYGVLTPQGVFSNGYPGLRFENRCIWKDGCGRFWMYGGYNPTSMYKDFWVFDPYTNQFAFLSDAVPSFGVYQVPAPGNYPPVNAGAAPFRDLQGNLWMFGGTSLGGESNALWRYQPDSVWVSQIPFAVSLDSFPPVCAATEICFGLPASCSNWNYQWNFGDPSTATDTASGSPACYTYTAPGTYSVTMTASNAACGTSADTTTIAVLASPAAGITSTPSPGPVLITDGTIQICFTNTSVPSNAPVSWTFSNGLSALNDTCFVLTVADTGSFCAYLVVDNGLFCTDSATTCIDVIAADLVYNIPNVFTPNGDGNNDNWFIPAVGITGLNCSIYDRWGVLIYEYNTPFGYWNGMTKNGKPASDGVYYYIAQLTDGMNISYNKSGFIHLIRGGQ